MASDDHDERLKGALAVALVVFLTYQKWCRAKTSAEWALVLDVLEDMETAEGEDSEDGCKYMAWVRDGSKYRQETVLYYSRPKVYSLNRTVIW